MLVNMNDTMSLFMLIQHRALKTALAFSIGVDFHVFLH